MAITLLPTPPTRQDPANFNTRADEFLGALPTFGAEANSLATDVNSKQVTASNAATTATNAANTATTKASEASTFANTAGTKASEASASATSAANSANTAGTKASEASASATSASNSATAAEASAVDASNSATAAATSAINAEIFATQQLKAASTTSNTPGLGDKSFTIETGKAFVIGMYLSITSSGASVNRMSGLVKSYNPATGALVVTVDAFTGSTARTDWVIGIAVKSAELATPYYSVSANTNATAFNRYQITATLDLTLPPSPNDGSWVDVVNTSGTTTSRVLGNGQNINGLAEDMSIDRDFIPFRLVFKTGYGWIIT